jgi:hypothetical protein
MKFKELRAGRLEGASPRGSELRTSDNAIGQVIGSRFLVFVRSRIYLYTGVSAIWGAGFEYWPVYSIGR